MIYLKPFPSGFLWGASTYQVEGGVDEDGKSPSKMNKKMMFITDIRKIALFAEMGLKAYRFSVAWTGFYQMV